MTTVHNPMPEKDSSASEASLDAASGVPSASISADPNAELLKMRLLEPPSRPGLIADLDRFEILSRLGAGGMGIVFLARDPRNQQHVAIKVMQPHLIGDARLVHRFLSEVRHMQGMAHPSIVEVLEVNDRPEGPYFVMCYMEKGSLAQMIQPGQPLDPGVTLRVALAIAEALTYVHAVRITHRDVKPANILIDSQGRAYLADFGLGQEFSINESIIDVRRRALEGSAPYMSPKIAAGEAEDTRRDIYAFGAVLYEMLTGQPVYNGLSTEQIITQIINGPPRPISDVNPQAPPGLTHIAEGAMQRELRDRYAQMDDIVADLKRVEQHQEPAGPHGRRRKTPGTISISVPWRRLIILIFIGVVIVAGVMMVPVWRLVRDELLKPVPSWKMPSQEYSTIVDQVDVPLRTVKIAPGLTEHDNGGVVTYGGNLYVWTGQQSAGTPLRTTVLERYDPRSGRWSGGAPVPEPSTGPTSFELGGMIYSIGGEGPVSGEFSRSVHRYDPIQDEWTPLRDFPQPIWEAMAVVCGGKAYVFGGRNGYGPTSARTWKYQDHNDRWIQRADMPRSVMNAAAVSRQGLVYVVGGDHNDAESSSESVDRLQTFNPTTNSWTSQALPWRLQGCQSAAYGDDIFIFAVKNFDETMNRWKDNHFIYRYRRRTERWTMYPFLNSTSINHHNNIAVIEGHAYVSTLHMGISSPAHFLKVELPTE